MVEACRVCRLRFGCEQNGDRWPVAEDTPPRAEPRLNRAASGLWEELLAGER